VLALGGLTASEDRTWPADERGTFHNDIKNDSEKNASKSNNLFAVASVQDRYLAMMS
jgi:hypothetical protein